MNAVNGAHLEVMRGGSEGGVVALVGLRPRLDGAVDTDRVRDPLVRPQVCASPRSVPGGASQTAQPVSVCCITRPPRRRRGRPSTPGKTASCVGESKAVLLGSWTRTRSSEIGVTTAASTSSLTRLRAVDIDDVRHVDAGDVVVLSEQRLLELFVVGPCVVARIGASYGGRPESPTNRVVVKSEPA